MEYTITLEDGRQIAGLGKNGDNYVSHTKVDESIFENNLKTMKVFDGETETVYYDVEFIQQMQWNDGTWYMAFRELSEQEKALKMVQSSILNMQSAINDIKEMKTAIERGLTI